MRRVARRNLVAKRTFVWGESKDLLAIATSSPVIMGDLANFWAAMIAVGKPIHTAAAAISRKCLENVQSLIHV